MNLIERLEEDFKKNQFWYFSLFVVPIVFYFYEFSNMSFTQDELRRHSSFLVDPQWLSQGRFGMYILNMLFSENPVFPYIGILFSSVLCSIVIRLFFIELCSKKDYPLLLTFIFVSCPYTYFFFSFSTISFSFGVIYALVFVSVFLACKEKPHNFLISALLLSFAVSIYQSAISLYFSMVSIVLFYRIIDKRLVFRDVVSFFIVGVLGVISYIIQSKIVSIYFPGNQSGYIEGFVNMPNTISGLVMLFEGLLVRTFDLLFLANGLPVFNLSQTLLISIFLVVGIITCVTRSPLLIISILFCFISPFLLEILSTNTMPIRSYIAIPLMLSFFAHYLYSCARGAKYLSFAVFSLLSVYIFGNAINITKLAFYDANSWEKDKRLANQIVSQIYSLPELSQLMVDNGGKIPIHSVGYIPKTENSAFYRQFDTVGKGFFSWGDNELQNSSNLFNSLGWDIFGFADLDVVRENVDKIRSLPNYPSQGSVSVIDNFVVVKLSDYTEAQTQTVCGNEPHTDKFLSCLVSYNPGSVRFSIDSNSPNRLQSKKLFQTKDIDLNQFSNVDVVQERSYYKLRSSVSDSYIVLPKMYSDSDLVLRLNLFYSENTSLVLYYKNNESEYYSESRVIRFKPLVGHNDMLITLPASIFNHGLRIDLSDNDKDYNLLDLEVLSVNF